LRKKKERKKDKDVLGKMEVKTELEAGQEKNAHTVWTEAVQRGPKAKCDMSIFYAPCIAVKNFKSISYIKLLGEQM
jgi:hypothetical protein